VRNALATASANWLAIGADARHAWESWAKVNPVTNRVGESIRLQGNSAYVELNSRLVQVGSSPVTDPPIVGTPGGLSSVAGTFDVGAGDFELAYGPSPLGTGMKLWVIGCLLKSASIVNVNNLLRHFYTSAAAAASPANIEGAFVARFGQPVVGDVVVLRAGVLDGANGQLSSFLEARGTVVST
jgi:hypothetical protein